MVRPPSSLTVKPVCFPEQYTQDYRNAGEDQDCAMDTLGVGMVRKSSKEGRL